MASSRSLRRRWQRRIVAGAIALVGLAVIAVGLRGFLPSRADRPAARQAIDVALTQLRNGNPSDARDAAARAVSADSGWGMTHVVLARMQLALGDGLGANASLDRARASGFDMSRVHQFRARALMFTGDLTRAQAELAQADPQYAVYSDIVRGELATRSGDFAAALRTLGSAVAARPGDGPTWLALARARRAAGDLAGAIGASERAVTLSPNSTDALAMRAVLVRGQYGPVASLPWFERALASDPRNHDALIEYAATLGEVGRTRDMLAAVRRATRVRKGSPQALYLQAVLAARAQRFDLAADILDHAGGAIDDVPGVMLLRGILDLRAGDAQQAAVHLRELVAIQPMNLTARNLLATAYARGDASRNAIDTLRPVVARGDADSYALTLSARAHERIGDREQAARLLDRASTPLRARSTAFSADDELGTLEAQAAQSALPATRIALIRGLIGAGDTNRALAEARSLAQAHPGVPAAQMLLGDAAMLAGRAGDAVAPYARAASLRFDEPAALRLIEAYEFSDRRPDAARTLALFLSQNPGNLVALRLSANWQLAAGDNDAALATLETVHLHIGDRDPALLAALSAAYLAVGDAPQAVEHAAAAYALQPANPAIADAYGAALLAAGNRLGARALLQKAAILAPGDPIVARHLAEARAAN